MAERWRNFLVGLSSVAGLVCLAVIMSLFGYVPEWIEKGYSVNVELNVAGGLTRGSLVKLSGIHVGKVRSVTLAEFPKHGVVVLAFIQDDVRIPRDAAVSVEAPLIGGSPTLAFHIAHLDEGQLGNVLATDGAAVVQGRVPTLTSQFTDELKAALSNPFEQFERLSTEWTTVAKNLNQLIEPRTLHEVDASGATVNVATLMARADEVLAELRTTIASANTWLNDEDLRTNIRTGAANAAAAAKQIEVGAQRIGQLADGARQQIDQLTKRYIAVADDVSRAINVMQVVVDKANQGEGSVGRLLNDGAFYNNLNDAVERITEAVKELQLLIQKWKKEGVPVSL